MTLFTLPDPSVVITSTSVWSVPFFTEFLPIIYVSIGLLVMALGIRWLGRTIKGGARGVLGGSRRRGRGRRR